MQRAPGGEVSAEPEAEEKAKVAITRVQEKGKASLKEKAKAVRVVGKVKAKVKAADAKEKAVAADAKEEASIRVLQKADTPKVKTAVKTMIMTTIMIATGATTKKAIGTMKQEWSALLHIG